jgi:hypothetical protein
MGTKTKLIGIAAVVLIIVTTGYSDIMPQTHKGTPPATHLENNQSAIQQRDLPESLQRTEIADVSLLPIGQLAEPQPNERQTAKTPPSTIMVKEQGSATMCLYALLGLSVFSSAHRVKWHNLIDVPEWYHLNGPSQVGHSHVVSPDLLGTAPVCCLIQPDMRMGDDRIKPQYRGGTLVSLWRISQYISQVDGSRGPPIPFVIN